MHGEQLTVRVKPQHDESLLSYLIRLTLANGISIHNFINSLRDKDRGYFQSDDKLLIDFSPLSLLDISKLSRITNVLDFTLLSCTFHNMLAIFCGSSDVERSRFLSGLQREYLCYCPLCISEKKYYKINWKINQINACVLHKVKLFNACPVCMKLIKYKDIEVIGLCPYCDFNLDKVDKLVYLNSHELKREKWYNDNWVTLTQCVNISLPPNELAISIIYILSGYSEIFVREDLTKKLESAAILPTLLQHARGTLSMERTLHLGFVFDILKDNNSSIDDLLNLKVPEQFRRSLLVKTMIKSNSVACFAPWCDSFGISGSLIRTGTSTKIKKNGTKFSYYLTCMECGCEYAFDEDNKLIERTYFIDTYEKLSYMCNETDTINDLATKLGVSKEKIKRVFAYFRTRNFPFKKDIVKQPIKIQNNILKNLVSAINKYENINVIKKWDCFNDYNEFLTYRYHQDVIGALFNQHRTLKAKANSNSKEYAKIIKDVLEQMYSDNEDITIKSICKKVGVCPETIRNWGFNKLIAEKKKSQREKRILDKKDEIYLMVDNFSQNNNSYSSKDLYQYIGVRRPILWRIAPEITAYISIRLKERKSNNEIS